MTDVSKHSEFHLDIDSVKILIQKIEDSFPKLTTDVVLIKNSEKLMNDDSIQFFIRILANSCSAIDAILRD